MLVDASYLAWVRPARRVHLALSVGMTLTGVILTLFGMIGSRAPEAAPTAVVVDSAAPPAVPSAAPLPPSAGIGVGQASPTHGRSGGHAPSVRPHPRATPTPPTVTKH